MIKVFYPEPDGTLNYIEVEDTLSNEEISKLLEERMGEDFDFDDDTELDDG